MCMYVAYHYKKVLMGEGRGWNGGTFIYDI